jgi:hypothetical protein
MSFHSAWRRVNQALAGGESAVVSSALRFLSCKDFTRFSGSLRFCAARLPALERDFAERAVLTIEAAISSNILAIDFRSPL